MSDPTEAVYDAEPHTRAKHQILREYFTRWLRILASQSLKIGRAGDRLLYVDGFAGAGEYTDHIPGSPLVAIETALQNSRGSTVPIRIKLIELQHERVLHLRQIVAKQQSRPTETAGIIVEDPIEGDCEAVINTIIDEHERRGTKLGPALFFLDQYGYSSFSMSLIGRILGHQLCEVFSYLNWNRPNQFMADESKHAGITKAFGGEEWKGVLGLVGKAREDRFRDLYLDALRTRAKAAYAYPFAMRNRDDRVIYWLFFCTNNLRGLEEMKRAMWTVDRSGGFEFSDKHASQLGCLFPYTHIDLAKDLLADLNGQELSRHQVREHVLTSTPAYTDGKALGLLEKEGTLLFPGPPTSRRRGSFNDDSLRLRFQKRPGSDERTLFD